MLAHPTDLFYGGRGVGGARAGNAASRGSFHPFPCLQNVVARLRDHRENEKKKKKEKIRNREGREARDNIDTQLLIQSYLHAG